MNLVRRVCGRTRLFMQFNPLISSSHTSDSAPSLAQRLLPQKRSFSDSHRSSASQKSSTEDIFAPKAKQPCLEPRAVSYSRRLHTAVRTVQRNQAVTFSPEFVMPSPKNTPSSSHSRQQPSSSNRGRNVNSKSNRAPQPAVISRDQLQEPVRDLTFIQSTFNPRQEVMLKTVWLDNPKAPLSNYVQHKTGKIPVYYLTQGSLASQKYYRCTVVADEALNIIGEGDGHSRKHAEQLAALSAVYQLVARGLIDGGRKSLTSISAIPAFLQTTVTPLPSAKSTVESLTLSDGSNVNYERARSFMDYYCRRFGFGKPDITFEEAKKRKGNSMWEATMTVGGRRIGLGSGQNKKAAQINVYLDVVQYLESCDTDLWKAYVEAAKTGKDVGLAPKVFFNMSESLNDEIRDLCTDIKRSTLYKNRPSIGSGMTGSDPAKETSPTAESKFQPRIRPKYNHSPQFFAAKSEQLLRLRKAYLDDPRCAAMRAQRASLPVTTRSADILAQIAQNDVTICMAATGSGKTTQIPQLLLDEAIDRGEGARCNIVCTQPRRIAAISVADRVARERGEVLGSRSTIGYQVRFETKLPEAYGSITFCTTGIFLKRMQSALLGGISGDGRTLDDVTHVVVDEVHERDVDTDLLLVVLKRLLAERKAQNKPIKIILMSATIDPTLFQHYFKDERGVPAPVIEVPGRSFPVVKHFLEETVPVLAPRAGWVFREDSVVKYLNRELSQAVTMSLGTHNTYGRSVSPVSPRSEGREGVDELEIPYPLVALTIAHVLDISDSGHVLVFLPGWDDITSVQRILLDRARHPLLNKDFSDQRRFAIHLLHSTIPVQEQQAVFEPPPEGVRRIILATNIAETSITIPDVVYVVDTAKIKENRYDPERHMSSLVSAWVGSSNLNQRAGRAGRHRPGEYFGILGQKRAAELHPYQTVEMKRVDLSNVVMHVKALDFPGMEVEEVLAATIEPPAPERVEAAMNDLKMVGALDDKKNLTSLGRVLLQLPVEVQMGRLVLFGSFFRCLDQALTLAAILTNRDPFLSPPAMKKEAAAIKNSWTPQEFRSDPLAVLFAYNAWWGLQSKGDHQAAHRFCIDNFLSRPTLLMIQKIKGHLLQAMYHAGVIDVSAGGSLGMIPASRDHVPPQLNTSGDSLPLLAALIAIASQPKFAVRATERTYRTARDKATFIHPSSVNHRKREEANPETASPGEKQIYAFTEKRQNVSTGSTNPQMFLLGSTRLDPLSYMLFGAYRIEVTERGLECDEWLPIVGNIDALDDIQRLKTLMESCMLRVFEGVSKARRARGPVPRQRIAQPRDNLDESDEDDDPHARDYTLSATEIKELDFLTRDIVRILDKYNEERIGNQSRRASRPATPQASPALGPSRLPSLTVPGRGSRSGYSTPYNVGSTYSSRPGTPSLLSSRIR